MSNNLYIIDGHAQIYAAYYAATGGNLVTASGEPTKATYIFTTMMLKLLKERTPDMLVVTMDAPGPSFRHEMYDKYKANRSAMPEDLPQQIERIEQILTAMDVPVLRVAGYEADDILATIAKRAEGEDKEIFILTSDKDMLQLVNSNIRVSSPYKEGLTYDVDKVKERYGVEPEQMPDVLALWGDASDNIPGVSGIGLKTAVKLIQKFGNLENLLSNLERVLNQKQRENLKKSAQMAKLSKRLVTIDENVPISFNLSRCWVGERDRIRLAELFRRLEFKKLVQEIESH